MNIVLSENQILELINGESIKISLTTGEKLNIRMSYLKDLAKPLKKYKNQIVSESCLNRANLLKEC